MCPSDQLIQHVCLCFDVMSEIIYEQITTFKSISLAFFSPDLKGDKLFKMHKHGIQQKKAVISSV